MNDEKRPITSYPSNSQFKLQKPEPPTPEPKKVEKVTTGVVKQQKKGLGRKIVETFVGEDVVNVRQYLIHDVLVPAIKSTLSDMVQGGIEMMLFGERKGTKTRRDGNRSYVSYNSYSAPDNKRREMTQQSRARHDFGDIVLQTRGEAEEVLSHLVDLTIDYGQATVSDLYDLVGITGQFTDNKYGWTDLSRASISRTRDGYVLVLPRPILID